MKLSENNSVLT